VMDAIMTLTIRCVKAMNVFLPYARSSGFKRYRLLWHKEAILTLARKLALRHAPTNSRFRLVSKGSQSGIASDAWMDETRLISPETHSFPRYKRSDITSTAPVDARHSCVCLDDVLSFL
jgi:hypothetical protein